MIMRQNIIKKNPVMVEDIEILKKIFGPDVSRLEGKNNKTKSKSGCG